MDNDMLNHIHNFGDQKRLTLQMKHTGCVLLFLFMAGLVARTFAAPNGPPPPPETLPVYRLNAAQESAVYAAADQILLSDLSFSTAAVAKVNGIQGQNLNYSEEAVDREQNGTADVYASALPDPTLDTVVGTGYPTTSEIFDFKDTGNSVQAFATMNAIGSPFLWLQGFGITSGFVNSSWTTRFVNPKTSMQNVYLSFDLPTIKVEGETEEDGPAQWLSRVRVDVMVDGYPAWSASAMRFNDLGASVYTKPYFLTEYGADLGFNASTGAAGGQQVTLFLGYFKGGQSANISLQVSGEITMDKPCALIKDEYFCTRANMSMYAGGRVMTTRFLLKTTPVGTVPGPTPVVSVDVGDAGAAVTSTTARTDG